MRKDRNGSKNGLDSQVLFSRVVCLLFLRLLCNIIDSMGNRDRAGARANQALDIVLA